VDSCDGSKGKWQNTVVIRGRDELVVYRIWMRESFQSLEYWLPMQRGDSWILFQHLVRWAEILGHSYHMHVESVLGEIVLDSCNGRYFLHFQICLIFVHHNLFCCYVTFKQQMSNVQDNVIWRALCIKCVYNL
jgi:hypothetical protein